MSAAVVLKRAVVWGLAWSCTGLDVIPTVGCRYGGWGCRIGLSRASHLLDRHWDTQVWRNPPP